MKKQEMWAWWDNEKQKFYHIYGSKLQVEMCFSDGGKYHIQKGEGEIIKVIIQQK